MSLPLLPQWVKSRFSLGGPSRRAARRGGAGHSAAGLRPSVWPRLEQLEDRLLPASTVGTVTVSAPGNLGDEHTAVLVTTPGVGFQNNVLAVVQGVTAGQVDINPSHYTAQINYNDGNGWQPGVVTTEQGANGPIVVVKGSDVYNATDVGWNPIEVQVNYLGTPSAQTQTVWAVVTPAPSGLAGIQPPPITAGSGQSTDNVLFGVGPPGVLGDTNSAAISATTGVALTSSVVGVVEGYVNGVLDTNPGDYQAWVNWGDGSQWVAAQLVPNTSSATSTTSGPASTMSGSTTTSSSTVPFDVEANHVYNQTGTFIVSTYVVGPDGSSEYSATAAATVTQNPNPTAPIIATNPVSQTVTAGQTATFTASANGTPTPTVQWQVSTDGGQTFSDISGATANTLTLSNVTASMNGAEYQAVFTNNQGTVTTGPVTLTVTPIAISPAGGALPAGTVGTAYSETLAVSGGGGTLGATTTIESGSLPDGLTMTNNNNGTVTISGTPTFSGLVTFQLTATDSTGDPSLTQTYTLTISPAIPTSSSLAFSLSQVAQDASWVQQGLLGGNPNLFAQGEQNFLALLGPLSASQQAFALDAFFTALSGAPS
jgi:hypothetical protein